MLSGAACIHQSYHQYYYEIHTQRAPHTGSPQSPPPPPTHTPAGAHGNTALALMLTVTTNVLAVFTVPFTVPLVIASAQNVNVDPADLLVKLVITILVPLLVGKALRELFPAVRRFVTAHKVGLGLLNNGSLICIVWQVSTLVFCIVMGVRPPPCSSARCVLVCPRLQLAGGPLIAATPLRRH